MMNLQNQQSIGSMSSAATGGTGGVVQRSASATVQYCCDCIPTQVLILYFIFFSTYQLWNRDALALFEHASAPALNIYWHFEPGSEFLLKEGLRGCVDTWPGWNTKDH